MNAATHLFGKCEDTFSLVEPSSVSLVLADLPYGQTACPWDTPIDLDAFWAHCKRILVPGGAVALTASGLFEARLKMSQPKWFRHEWVWEKPQGTNPGACKVGPMKNHELVLIFGQKGVYYNPQMEEGTPYAGFSSKNGKKIGEAYGSGGSRHAANKGTRFPKSVRRFAQDRSGLHPTQKPVPLMEYIIRTYSRPGDTVADFCMGSGTTGVACANTGRVFIGGESDPDYFEQAVSRVSDAYNCTGTREETARCPTQS